MMKQKEKANRKFEVTFKEKHSADKTFTIPAEDSLEAYEWGERNAAAMGVDAKVEVTREVYE